MDVDANIHGKFTFGEDNGLQVLSIPLSPFSDAGVFSIRPSINVAVQASARVQVFGFIHAGTTFALPEHDFFVQILGDVMKKQPNLTNDFSADIAIGCDKVRLFLTPT